MRVVAEKLVDSAFYLLSMDFSNAFIAEEGGERQPEDVRPQ